MSSRDDTYKRLDHRLKFLGAKTNTEGALCAFHPVCYCQSDYGNYAVRPIDWYPPPSKLSP